MKNVDRFGFHASLSNFCNYKCLTKSAKPIKTFGSSLSDRIDSSMQKTSLAQTSFQLGLFGFSEKTSKFAMIKDISWSDPCLNRLKALV
jgi:hypothetical protein